MITYPHLLRLWAWLRGGKPIWLEHFDGELTPSIMMTCPNGKTFAYRSHFTGIGFCNCHDDGTTTGATYIDAWHPA